MNSLDLFNLEDTLLSHQLCCSCSRRRWGFMFNLLCRPQYDTTLRSLKKLMPIFVLFKMSCCIAEWISSGDADIPMAMTNLRQRKTWNSNDTIKVMPYQNSIRNITGSFAKVTSTEVKAIIWNREEFPRFHHVVDSGVFCQNIYD